MKTHVYFIPGLGANSKIFKNIKLPKTCESHFLEWIIPTSKTETIQEYAKRMSALISESNPVLIGVSLGGIMAQEISKHIKVKKVIIISSVKHKEELPLQFKIAKYTKAYKLLPIKLISNIKDLTPYAIGRMAKIKAQLYKVYFTAKNEIYLRWGVYQVLHWNQTKSSSKLVHIQGTKDVVFPVKNIKDCILVEGGTHVMILNKSKKINKILAEILE